MADNAHTEPAAEAAAKKPAAAGGGGFGAWLPLLFTVIAMPALAYAATTYYIVPQVQKAAGGGVEAAAASESGSSGSHGSGGHGSGHGAAASDKQSVSLNKIVVNVAGTMGTRYLMTSVTLTGKSANFKDKVEEHKDQLLDLASSTLSNKSISELEKPGARGQVRTELLTAFNSALGDGVVQEIFITEFAIQ